MLGAFASRKEGQNDDRVFCHNVAQAVIPYNEVPETGIRLMLPHGVHLWKLGDHLNAIESGLLEMPGESVKCTRCRLGPKDFHRCLVRRRIPRITRS